MRSRHHDDPQPQAAARDESLAKKKAKIALLDRIDPKGSDEVSSLRLVAEVDLALSEGGESRD